MMEKCFDEGTLQAFLDNELSTEMSQTVARHLAACDPCTDLLATIEEETAFAFSALEQEFSVLVPTQRLWTKITETIEVQHRKRSLWQSVLAFISGISLTNPHVVGFASLLLIVGVVSALIVIKNDVNSGTTANVSRSSVPAIRVAQTEPQTPVVEPDVFEPKSVNVPKERTTPQIPVERANYVETYRKPAERVEPHRDEVVLPPALPQYLDGEESYVKTISRLEKTVDASKDEVLNPSARFSYEKDLAVVNDTISKMKKEVKKNPKNEDAKQILFASYQNKIELLSSVTQRGELMASLR